MTVADLLIRNLDAEVLERLKARAKRSGRSLQSETKGILEQAAGRTLDEALASAASRRKKLGKRLTDSADVMRQDRAR